MKLKRYLPIFLLALILGYMLMGGRTALPQSAPTERPADELSLVSPSPVRTSEPTAAPTPEPTAEPAETDAPTAEDAEEAPALDEDGSYTSKEDVALYLHLYGHLPGNYVTKKEAEAAGWTGGTVERVLPGKCIGGDYFGNYEGKLPKAKGRKWAECDLTPPGAKSRGAARLIYSNDGLIYYTPDHYETFELLYD